MLKRHVSVLMVAAGCLVLSACSGGQASVTAGQAPAGTQKAPSAPQTDPAPSSSVPLPTRGAAGAIPDAPRLRELALQPGEAAGVPDPERGIRDLDSSELRPLPRTEASSAPCPTMWELLRQKGAQAAVSQTFDSGEPGSPQMTFLASYTGTGAATAFAQLRTAVAACPSDDSDERKATARYEDLDKAGFPEDTIHIRMTFEDEGSAEPVEVLDRIVARVGVCIVDMTTMGPEPYPSISEAPALRQIERLRAAQGL
ncbi:hypothetical protein [Streptomyces xanthophaeus]|uniref:hypothetical protein n=1 Tax=Streptomyces xanthophaeus TaxID=67385 RepID=UPI0026475A5C|nr:hypothetical protein [Streptomyces xanthophaeus]WKD31123.1 hypothetical protein KO717_03500 [Streptomyces xanthophaeus]